MDLVCAFSVRTWRFFRFFDRDVGRQIANCEYVVYRIKNG